MTNLGRIFHQLSRKIGQVNYKNYIHYQFPQGCYQVDNLTNVDFSNLCTAQLVGDTISHIILIRAFIIVIDYIHLSVVLI